MSMVGDIIDVKIEQLLRRIHTSLPGKIINVRNDVDKECTVVDVQPLINRVDMAGYAQEYQVLQDVPVAFPRGGGACLTFDVEVGDLVEIRFYSHFPGDYRQSDGSTPVTPSFPMNLNINNCCVVPGDCTYKNGKQSEEGKTTYGYDDVVISISKLGEINLGGSGAERLVLGDSFLDTFLAHSHDTPSGPTSNLKVGNDVVAVAGVTNPTGLQLKEDSLSSVTKTE